MCAERIGTRDDAGAAELELDKDSAVVTEDEHEAKLRGPDKEAVTMAIDSWHIDLEQFLELQTENGDQRGKAYDIYPQIVVSDLFMERVENKQSWTLFDPYEVRKKYGVELCEFYGDEFREFYKKLELEGKIK